ncbi:hypothetical protein [Nocardia sp. NPDC056100]|uniref:hypothetical protein n=1 Tax=Nocardia sp. NPDC056100 TaxID=3345712 RepID=UPI0035DA337E
MTTFRSAMTVGIGALVIRLRNSARTPDDSRPRTDRDPIHLVRERIRSVLRWAWMGLLGLYAAFLLYAGVTGMRSPGDELHDRLLWAALCLSTAAGFIASALWIHRRGTHRARPWREGLRNALSWVLTGLLANLSFAFLLTVIIPHRDAPNQAWYLLFALDAIYLNLAFAIAAGAVWVRRKTRTGSTIDSERRSTNRPVSERV